MQYNPLLLDLLKFRIKVDAFNIVIYHSGPMFSSTSADRLYISFDVEDDERAVQDMHRLFFHEKCKPIDQLNIQLFGNDVRIKQLHPIHR